MFHPRGMGPRGMRPGMRPPFGPRGPPGPPGPQFDAREKEPFFRPPFDDVHRPPGPLLRPPFGPMGPKGHDGPWRNPENGPWMEPGADHEELNLRENHHPKPKFPEHKAGPPPPPPPPPADRENRNRNRKSRWGNASPSMNDDSGDNERPEGEKKPRRRSSDHFDGEHNSSKFNQSLNDDRPPGTENESFDDSKLNIPEPPPIQTELNQEKNFNVDPNDNQCFETPAKQSFEPSAQPFEPTNEPTFEPPNQEFETFESTNNQNFESSNNENFLPPGDNSEKQNFESSNERCFEPPVDQGFQQTEREQFFEPEPQMETKADFPAVGQPEREAVSECVSEAPCEAQEEQSSL